MKHIAIITSALMLLVPHASAQSDSEVNVLAGNMSCKVKSNKVIEIEEGIVKEYDGWTDGFKEGDNLALQYDHINGRFGLLIEDKIRNSNPFAMALSTESDNVGIITSFKNSYAVRKPFGIEIFFSTDLIYARNGKYIDPSKSLEPPQTSSLQLKRYYKNDWQGIVTVANYFFTSVYTLDCRHTDDQLDKKLSVLDRAKRIYYAKERQTKAKANIQKQRDEEIIELYRWQKEALAKQLDEANKRIADLEAAQE